VRQRLAFAAAMGFILAAALALRLPRLGDRPFHGDEAVHAVKFRDLWEKGRYEYDPSEYHGPTIYYAALPVIAARGRATFAETQEADYRLAIALIGAAMVLLYPLLRDGMGAQGALWAALLTAVSSPFVFYSRYFIQEVPLAGLTLALIACGWRYHVSGRAGWLMGAALSAGLLIATKETAVLILAALGLAAAIANCGMRHAACGFSGPEAPNPHAACRMPQWVCLALAILVASAVAFVLLSGFFSHVRGPVGYFESAAPWLRRAGGTELHRHPWHYYFSLLAWQHPRGSPVWTELFVLGLAAAGAFWAVLTAIPPKLRARLGARHLRIDSASRGDRQVACFARFALVYSLALAGIFSLIPYKTPWNLLSFYLGFILLAGLGARTLLSLLRPIPLKAIGTLLLLAGAAHLAWQAQRTTFHYRDDNPGPYAYAQPLRGLREIEQRLGDLAAVSPHKDATVAQVIWGDGYYWPLPWYLRRLKHVGYWVGAVPNEEEARLMGTPIILSSAEFDEPLTERLNASHFMIGFNSVRTGVLAQVWVKNELWESYIMKQSQRRTPEPRSMGGRR
jgi:uncharacterized protein (TIGR03663 family)